MRTSAKQSVNRGAIEARRIQSLLVISFESVTFEADEAINLSDEQSIGGAEKLELLYRGAVLRRPVRRRGDDEGDVVAGVRIHDVVSTDRPVNPLHFVTRMLNHHRRRLRRLAIPHSQ